MPLLHKILMMVGLSLLATCLAVYYVKKMETFNVRGISKRIKVAPPDYLKSQNFTKPTGHQPTDRLVFNRIPKCGTKGLRLLFSNLSKTNCFHHTLRICDESWAFDSSKLSETATTIMNLQTPAVYTRHMHFIDFSTFNNDSKPLPSYINIIRDPVDRLISWYYFQRLNPHSWPGLDRRQTFNDCVRNNASECVDPKRILTLIPFFCGHEDICMTFSEEAFTRAKENLKHYPVVGYLDNIEGFLRVLEHLWPSFFLGARAVYKDMYRTDQTVQHRTMTRVEPSQKAKEIMKKRLALDYRFYDLLKNNFDELYSRLFSHGEGKTIDSFQ